MQICFLKKGSRGDAGIRSIGAGAGQGPKSARNHAVRHRASAFAKPSFSGVQATIASARASASSRPAASAAAVSGTATSGTMPASGWGGLGEIADQRQIELESALGQPHEEIGPAVDSAAIAPGRARRPAWPGAGRECAARSRRSPNCSSPRSGSRPCPRSAACGAIVDDPPLPAGGQGEEARIDRRRALARASRKLLSQVSSGRAQVLRHFAEAHQAARRRRPAAGGRSAGR